MPSSVLFVSSLASLLLGAPMVGPSVGNADVLSTEGVRLYNQKKYGKAAESLSKAVRANPAAIPPYLTLARSLFAAKQTARACQAYKAYLKAAPDSLDRTKAQAEAELCERQLRASGKKPLDTTTKVVEMRAQLYAALEQQKLLGPGSASEALQTLLDANYLGVDLADMGQKLHLAALGAAESLRQKAGREKLPVETLKSGPALYQLAADTGPTPPHHQARGSFLLGLASLNEGNAQAAEQQFASAAQADATEPDYVFYRALAVYMGGQREGALRSLETQLPNDPRTAVLRTELALGSDAQAGADELSRVLFSQRFAK